ncbi:YceI family protein [Aliifodinibius sp. S!AR15-10]|uniref:YceI family protein n=1 Tax=Aliifodinibius sp. S!AR15-10 TaxID=2950437 RepID=UPI002861C377|nr:YceI family protein [Aliifodinibius sp. S!AR15-10]MDR8391342.1 YceI family protein [Aliifodinibius sp. S!AR15-10]
MKSLSIYILGFMAALVTTTAMAQSNTYQLLPKSEMTITGTSTIHDWECDVETINLTADLADALFNAEVPVSEESIKALSITVPVKSIESGKGGMNNKIYGALKEKKFSNVEYVFSKAELVSGSQESGSFTLNTTGQLTIAGQTRNVSFPVQATLSGSDTISFEGSYSLNMKDFGVDPPSAVFGTIKSGEEVTISFNIAVANKAVANNK